MRKLSLILVSAVLLTSVLSGCKEKEDEKQVRNAKSDSISLTESEEQTQSATKAAEESKSEKDNSINDSSESDTESESRSESSDTDSGEDIEGVTEPNYGSYSNDSGDIMDIAVEMHRKSCETQWKFLFSCPYQLDYDDMSGDAARVIGVNSLTEISDEYCKVFADDSELAGKYFEDDGKVYCRDGGRGADVQYTGTELILVSDDDDTAKFTAVSHYVDPETNEPFDSRSYDFEIINDNGSWKTSVFTLPY